VSALPRTGRDVVKLPPKDAALYRALAAFYEVTGLWRYPANRSGDLETMRLLDKVYWFSKAGRPIRRAVRGSRLEAFFTHHQAFEWNTPEDFTAAATLTLSAAGDLMNHAYLAKSDSSLFRPVADLLFDVDLSMANLECVVRKEPAKLEIDMKTGPPLMMNPEAFETVARRWDFLAAACNHSLDFGEEGIASTTSALRGLGIAFHGINEREEDSTRATIVDKRGFRIGIVAHTFGLNAHRPPAHRPRIVNSMKLNGPAASLDLENLVAQLAHCQRENVDFVIAHLHWGMEFEFFPRPEQMGVAHRLAELGVDAIVGHHPHVLQPVEYYRTRRDPARVVPICYSLGNLTNPFSAPFMCKSGVARFELVKGTSSGNETRTYVRRARVIEVEQTVDPNLRQLALQLGN
jgi:poly-gamma-glutamate capsule biosynthesis protein CapA/YwtB (metallophosphatase superfamily)